MTIRGAELLSADLKDCDEIHMGGLIRAHSSPPHTCFDLQEREGRHVHAAGNEPEAKIDYWYRHTSTVLAVTTVRHRPELSLVCQDGRCESVSSAAVVHTGLRKSYTPHTHTCARTIPAYVYDPLQQANACRFIRV